MADMPAAPAADEMARRDEALSNACIDECMHQPEVGPLEGAAPLAHPSAAPDITIVIVTHNLQEARRVGDFTAFLTAAPERDGALVGRLIEFGTTEKIFSRPADERTEAYVTGRFG